MGELGVTTTVAVTLSAAAAAALIIHRQQQKHKEKLCNDLPFPMARTPLERVPLDQLPKLKNDLLLRALRGDATERVPVWCMRQAGRQVVHKIYGLRQSYLVELTLVWCMWIIDQSFARVPRATQEGLRFFHGMDTLHDI